MKLDEKDLEEYIFIQGGKRWIKCFKSKCDLVLESITLLQKHIESVHNVKSHTCKVGSL